MADKALSRDDLAFGRAVLLATDSLGMSAEGAFWLYDRRDNEWRYFLVSSLLDRVGARELYLRLNDALAKTLSERETREFQFYIAGPNERLVKDIRKCAQTGAYSSEPKSVTVEISERPVKAWIYRLTDRLNEAGAKRVQRRFRQRTNDVKVA